MSILGGILGGFASSVFGNIGNQISAAQQYRYQKRLMEQQNQYNKEYNVIMRAQGTRAVLATKIEPD